MRDPQNDLLTTHDAADLLGMKYQAFFKRYSRATLSIDPVARLGGQLLWLRSDIERYKHNHL